MAESNFLRTFKTIAAEANRAWNEGDFKRAYAFLPDDFEYHLHPEWPEAAGVLHGREEVIAFFEELNESFSKMRSGPSLTIIEAGEQTMIVGFAWIGTGLRSGAVSEMEIWQVWEVDENLIPTRVTEFESRDAAVHAAGATRPRAERR